MNAPPTTGADQMQDLFSHEAQTADRDRSLTTAIIDRALEAGYSVRVQDAHGDNNTQTTRQRTALIAAVGTSRETTFHIIDMKADLGKNVGEVTIYHGEQADRITDSIGRNGDKNEAFIASLAPATIIEEIAAYSDELDEAAQLETVPTSALREGDRIKCNGCKMQLGKINESQSHKPDQHGAVYWSRARVIEQMDATVPMSWFDHDEAGNRTWLIQGNDLATWWRYK